MPGAMKDDQEPVKGGDETAKAYQFTTRKLFLGQTIAALCIAIAIAFPVETLIVMSAGILILIIVALAATAAWISNVLVTALCPTHHNRLVNRD
jgi:hypothetical protein